MTSDAVHGLPIGEVVDRLQAGGVSEHEGVEAGDGSAVDTVLLLGSVLVLCARPGLDLYVGDAKGFLLGPPLIAF